MSEPNLILRDVRKNLRMSQEDMARAIRQDGQRTGDVNNCSKRLVQRWEAGVITMPRGSYARALEHVTGLPVSNLGFADQKYGVDRDQAMVTGIWLDDDPKATGPLTGIWRSRYEYPSSSRGAMFASEHYVILIQHGARLQVRSVPAAESRVVMDLAVNGTVITGTWSEETSASGYYGGGVYFGAIQMLADPTGHRLAGKWIGFGRDFDVNVGPWTLTLVSSDTSRETVARYNRTPDPDEPAPDADRLAGGEGIVSRPALTLLRNDRPACTGLADRGMDALMRQAVEEIRACREVISEAGPEAPGLKACADKLDSIGDGIRQAAQMLTIMAPGPDPGAPRTRTRHLHAVGDDTA